LLCWKGSSLLNTKKKGKEALPKGKETTQRKKQKKKKKLLNSNNNKARL
jgi:hypothetical protein